MMASDEAAFKLMDESKHRRLEEAGLSAWPALQQILHDGWVLRFANGFTKRANSVNALYPSTLDLDQKISRCEKAYAERGLPVIFRMTPYSQPDGLDARLEQRAYKMIDRTLVMEGPLSSQETRPPSSLEIRIVSLEGWLNAYAQLRTLTVEDLAALRGIAMKIPTPACPVLGYQDGDPIGYGLGVLNEELIGIFGLHVDPSVRRSGCGKAMLSRIFHWAEMRGAKQTYLQVEADNEPACRLYEKLGFEVAYHYWYRIRV